MGDATVEGAKGKRRFLFLGKDTQGCGDCGLNLSHVLSADEDLSHSARVHVAIHALVHSSTTMYCMPTVRRLGTQWDRGSSGSRAWCLVQRSQGRWPVTTGEGGTRDSQRLL